MAIYVDGFVTPVPRKNIKKYKDLSKKMGRIMRKYGALTYNEFQADDVPKGKWTSFPRSVKLKSGEVVFFSWITYKSRAHRDQVMKKAMQDPVMSGWDPKASPFDGKRMIYGGFKSFVEM